MTDEEMQKLYFDNPIVPVSEGLTIEGIEKKTFSRSIGLDNLPEELKNTIMNDPDSLEFCRQNTDLLNVYWVPKEESNQAFAGFATYDKDTIFVVYQTSDGKLKPTSVIAATVLHELQHKADIRAMNKYLDQHPDFPLDKVPTLITERNARLRELNYLNSLDLDGMSEEERSYTDENREQTQNEFDTAESLLKDHPFKWNYLEPPFEHIDIHAYAMDIYPPNIAQHKIETWKLLLTDMGYSLPERQWLMERIIGVFDKLPIDVSLVQAGKRDLFADFLGKLINTDKSKTEGFYNVDLYEVLFEHKENLKTVISTTIESYTDELNRKNTGEQEKSRLIGQVMALSQLLQDIESVPITVITKPYIDLLIENAVQARKDDATSS